MIFAVVFIPDHNISKQKREEEKNTYHLKIHIPIYLQRTNTYIAIYSPGTAFEFTHVCIRIRVFAIRIVCIDLCIWKLTKWKMWNANILILIKLFRCSPQSLPMV